MKRTRKPKTETGWILEHTGYLSKEYETPLEAMEEAKQIYEDDMKRHREYCDLMRQRKMHESAIKFIDDRLDDYINDGYDLLPDIRVLAHFNNGDNETIWENGETK